MKVSDTLRSEDSQLLHHASCLVSKANAFWVEESPRLEIHEFTLVILDALHF
jgi:hypothetical protein